MGPGNECDGAFMTIFSRLAGDFRTNFGSNRRAQILGAAFVACAIGWGAFAWIMLPSSEQRMRMKGDFATISDGLDKFKADLGAYPNEREGLAALTTQPARHPEKWKGPYLTQVPSDPWGRAYIYRVPAIHGKIYDLYSPGADGKSDTRDDYRR
jgi:type II secretion system protein G